MKRAALVLLVVPFVALWLYGCDKAENPLETETQVSETALYAPGGQGGGKIKAATNPIGCSQDDVAKWDEASGEWVCAEDLVGTAGGGPTTYFAYHRLDGAGWVTTASAGISVSKQCALCDDWRIEFPADMSDCAIVLSVDADPGSDMPYERSGTVGNTIWTTFGSAEFNLIAVCG